MLRDRGMRAGNVSRQIVRFVVLGAGATALAGERAEGASPQAGGVAAPSSVPVVVAPSLPGRPPDPLDAAARAPATEIDLAPSSQGRLGAWLVLGPFRSLTWGTKNKEGTRAILTPPEGLDEAALAPRLGAAPKPGVAWDLASSNEGALDLATAFHTRDTDLIGYVGGTVHVARAGRYVLLLGADDGIRLFVDGRAVFTRDEARPQRDDDDIVPLDLAAGDHALVAKLHQRDGAWAFEARLLDATLAPPEGAYLALPGTTANDARELASKMSWVSIDRGMRDDGYHPTLTARFPEGAPRGVPLGVHASLPGVFDVGAGDVPLDGSGVGELVVGLPPLVGAALAPLEDTELAFDVNVAGRPVRLPFYPRREVREAVARIDRSIAVAAQASDRSWLFEGSLESVEHLRERLVGFVAHGDADVDAETADAHELDELAAAMEARTDPYAGRSGAMRRAYRSPSDGRASEFGLYVPSAFAEGDPKADKKYPLIVALHGMNGYPMTMLRWFFGYDDPGKDAVWEDRHPIAQLPRLDAFVVTPDAHGNAMYRDLGEADVMRVVEWAMRRYPIDPARVTVTGPSMGGIGTAAIAFRYPSVFAAAEPLCGYHSYWIRRDIAGLPMRPWEKVLADERSNTSWAFNGLHIPLYIVHGKKDLPEENSGVLIEKYKALGYSEKDEHPDEGHNVWQKTYEGLKGARWLMWFKKRAEPSLVHFRTVRPRYGESAWVHVEELAAPDAWGDVTAQVKGPQRIELATKGVRALRLDRDALLARHGDPAADATVAIDGAALDFAAGAPLEMHLEGSTWRVGPLPAEGVHKRGDVAGPLRDVFHGPVLFVYGASDPAEARANEEVARRWAHLGWGVRVDYPVLSDAEFYARGESVANDAGLFLVGNARTNRVVRDLEPELPIRVEGDAVVVGPERVTGDQVGAAFIRPNPRRPDRYVVVVEGVDALGTFRSLSLPSLLPDFVVYDARVAPSRGQMLLGAGMVRAAGFFANDWSLPPSFADPLAAADRPGAKNEHDATPYLP